MAKGFPQSKQSLLQELCTWTSNTLSLNQVTMLQSSILFHIFILICIHLFGYLVSLVAVTIMLTSDSYIDVFYQGSNHFQELYFQLPAWYQLKKFNGFFKWSILENNLWSSKLNGFLPSWEEDLNSGSNSVRSLGVIFCKTHNHHPCSCWRWNWKFVSSFCHVTASNLQRNKCLSFPSKTCNFIV